jgi:hypothetical protein
MLLKDTISWRQYNSLEYHSDTRKKSALTIGSWKLLT